MLDRDNIASCMAYWGPDDLRRPIDIMLEEGLLTKTSKFLELLITPATGTHPGCTTYDQNLRQFHARPQEPYLLNIIDTGRVSHMAYGGRIRQDIGVMRGGRQGNNAFLEYHDYTSGQIGFAPTCTAGGYGATAILDPVLRSLDVDQFKALERLTAKAMGGQYPLLSVQARNVVQHFVLLGNYEIPALVTKDQHEQNMSGLNELHHLVLTKLTDAQIAELPKQFKSVSVGKKCTHCDSVTPLHFACINPNPEVLKTLLMMNGDVNMADLQMRKPIHFAAACESKQNLLTLIGDGANVIDEDKQKTTALHIAARAGRAENIALILGQAPQLLNKRTR